MRFLALLVIILGIATLIFGIIFFPQASSAKQKVADSLSSGVTLDTLNATYDKIDGQLKQLQTSGMPSTDPQYVMVFGQRTSLGLAKSNVGVAKVLQTMGIIDILIGVGLVFSGCAVWRKNRNAA
jgi:uncharacterized membrane protein YidH (DUF202 family)